MRAVGQDRRPGRRGRRPGAGARPARRATSVETPVDVFLPRYRGVPEPPTARADDGRCASRIRGRRRAAARSPSSTSPADGYRLRLVDHPAAFDREGFYGDAAGDYADNAWRFGLFCRAALEALRADGRPVDVLHLHDWHTGPAAIYRDVRYADDPIDRRRGDPHDPAQPRLPRLDAASRARPARPARRATGSSGSTRDGIDLLLAGIERAELVNTVSPGFAARGADARRSGWASTGALRAQGRPVLRHPQRARHDGLGPGHGPGPRPRRTRAATGPARRPAGPTC